MLYFSDFLALIFPRICAACGNSLWKHEEVICHSCEYHLPKTNYHLDPENPVARLFWGRIHIENAFAFLYFNKGSRVQRLIHQLKYKGRKDIGICIGRMYGKTLSKCDLFDPSALIVPVPLHKKKYMQRGYNQSEQFAIGLSKAMNFPVHKHLLLRTRATDTQTKKSRFLRYQNVKEVFTVDRPEQWQGKHLVLVDDVVTTGATLESCILALKAIPEVKISVVCIATAML